MLQVVTTTVNDCGPDRTDAFRGALWPCAVSVTSVYVGTRPTCLWQCSCSTITGVLPTVESKILSSVNSRRSVATSFASRSATLTRFAPSTPPGVAESSSSTWAKPTGSAPRRSSGQRTLSASRAAICRDIFLFVKAPRAMTMPSMTTVVRYGLTASSCVVVTNSG